MNQRNEWESICQRTEHLDPFYQAVWKKAYAEAIPITGTFELTCRCNFSCRMCYVHLKPDQMAGQGTDSKRMDPHSRRSKEGRNHLAVYYRRRASDASGV